MWGVGCGVWGVGCGVWGNRMVGSATECDRIQINQSQALPTLHQLLL
ncbi:hypothetical protein [Moorena sp. SIOASIH]|nr:hypothetical protein [Moorena sp. SIOASIH]